ncbi:MAG: hypothetical protein LKM37_00985 [Bacteroidales bacterium]|jgi:homoserine O-acetyltransferase|nr:hypothetical protein [Bacteroidales bacterium]
MVNLFDSQNVGRGRGGVEKALAKIKAKVLCIGIDSDILFPWQRAKIYCRAHMLLPQFRVK